MDLDRGNTDSLDKQPQHRFLPGGSHQHDTDVKLGCLMISLLPGVTHAERAPATWRLCAASCKSFFNWPNAKAVATRRRGLSTSRRLGVATKTTTADPKKRRTYCHGVSAIINSVCYLKLPTLFSLPSYILDDVLGLCMLQNSVVLLMFSKTCNPPSYARARRSDCLRALPLTDGLQHWSQGTHPIQPKVVFSFIIPNAS